MELKFPTERQWVDVIPGFFEVEVDPVTYVVQASARSYAKRMLAGLGVGEEAVDLAGGSVDGLPEEADPDRQSALEDLYYAQGLARRVVKSWRGQIVEHEIEDETVTVPVTPENIDTIIRDAPYVGERFVQAVQTTLLLRMMEGNVSMPLSSGPSEEGGNTADSAETTDFPAAEGSEVTEESDAPSSDTDPSQSTETSS